MHAGIGGRTVREAKENLTHKELTAWQTYREQYGPISQGQRLDSAIARLILVLRTCHGDKTAKLEDFLPQYGAAHKDDDEPELTPELFHRMFGEPD